MFQTNNNHERNSLLPRRISFLVIGVVILIMIYIFQLFSKSVLEHKNIMAIAKEQYIIEKQIPYERGSIYIKDKNYQNGYYPIALNEEKYQVLVVPKNVKDRAKTAKKLSTILKKEEKEIYEVINNDKIYIPPIAKRLDHAQADEILNLDLEGVLVISELSRFYPEDNLASQILGFLDAENIGRYGLEGYYNKDLTGKSGELIAEKDILGRLISVGNKIDPQNGTDIFTTIDRNIQYISCEYLKRAISEMQAEKGSIVIVDVKTGALISMVSIPDFNPNTYFDTAGDHPDYFVNPIVSNAWEPGSVMKPIVMSMSIDLGRIEPDTRETFGGNVWIQGYEIKNAKDRAFGDESMTQVLQNSDNIAMTWVGKKMSKEEMHNYFEKYGFGISSGIDLEAEAAGYLIDLDNWREISQATMSFGQGISVTPLQLVMAFAAIANDGKLMKPYVVEQIIKANNEVIETKPQEIRQVISQDTAKKIKEMLIQTLEGGYDIAGQLKGYKLGGKTGTAQIPKKDGTGYEDDKQSIHTFAGLVPGDDPKYAVLIILDRPQKYNFASSTTAPVFAKLAKWLLNYLEIKPTT